MRYISYIDLDPDLIDFPENWLNDAKEALDKVTSGEATIESLSRVWTDLKPALEKLIGKKCWYCEVIQSRSDKEIEHFRPKKRVWQVTPKHDGYFWLAFDYKNFRYSCQYCNKRRKDVVNNRVGGKGNFFPLASEEKRARVSGDERYETPILLDPCVEEDVKLLDFDDAGNPCPTALASIFEQERVKISIRLYHLDHSDLVEERKLLAINLEDAISDADYYFRKFASGEKEALDRFQAKLEHIKSAKSVRAEFSLFAERYIEGKLKPRVADWKWTALVFE
jgi:uncharacterized protein (TIGR02646 family)